MLKESLNVSFETNVKIVDMDTLETLVNKSNAIHAQNMSRVIARGLANEPNSIIHRIAFGNGGSFTDISGNIIMRDPNDGSGGEGWQSRLYNETYSEIVDNENPLVGTDPGSWGPDNKRTGGGAVPEDDPQPNSVTSYETGTKSVVVVSCFLNPNEPKSQLSTGGDTVSEEEKEFEFDELGFYSPGADPSSSPGYLRVDVDNKTADDVIPSSMHGKTYNLELLVDGSLVADTISIPDPSNPNDPVGSGPSGHYTFGDLCEGINTGDWLGQGSSSGILLNISKVYITNHNTGNIYDSIVGKESYGYLVFESGSSGTTSLVDVSTDSCEENTFFFDLTGGECCLDSFGGADAGVKNSLVNPETEQERLLTHITFPPILKKDNRTIKIVYSLTVSVSQVGCTDVEIED